MSLRKLYVSLDSILDTRLGVLNTISPDFAVAVTTDEKYFIRQEDVFSADPYGALTKENYAKVFKKFPREILESSFRTRMYVFIIQLRATLAQAAISSTTSSFEEMDINYFPFKITEDESKIIIDGVSKALGGTLKVNLVSIPIDEFKLDIARQNYSNMIMYNYHDWLNKHNDELKKNYLKEINLYVPRIFFDKIPVEEIDKLISKGQDPFDISQKFLAPFLNIEYLPIALYCADIPANKTEYSFETTS